MQDKNEIEYSDIDPELAQIIENKLQMPCNNKTKIQGIVSGVLFLMFIILCYTPVKDFIKNLGIDMFIVVLVIFFIVFALVFVPIHCCVKDKIILFENESLIQIDAQFKTNTVADDEMIIWQEDGSYPEKQEKYSFESMSPKEQIIALVAILPFVLGVAWLCLLEVYQQWIILLIYSIAGVICLGIVVAIFYLIKKELKKQIPSLKIGHIAYSYVITDKAVYSKIGKVDKPFERFYFNQIDEIYLYDTNTICLAARKGDEYDIELKFVKDFDAVVNLLKEKTGIEPEVVEL